MYVEDGSQVVIKSRETKLTRAKRRRKEKPITCSFHFEGFDTDQIIPG